MDTLKSLKVKALSVMDKSTYQGQPGQLTKLMEDLRLITLDKTQHREGPQGAIGARSPENGSQSAKKVGKDSWEEEDLSWACTLPFERRCCRMSGSPSRCHQLLSCAICDFPQFLNNEIPAATHAGACHTKSPVWEAAQPQITLCPWEDLRLEF